MTAYYNEYDPFAAAWLQQLIAAGHIAPGVVDNRSIEDVKPNDLAGFTQCHFFAGIGVWSYALRRAGWADDRPVWTGSCPCQPFSAAGKGGGFADERHLWPAFLHLIEQCGPAVVLGEQVASKDGLAWLDLVRADLEGSGRAFAAADLCAAGVGAPHIRQRSFWLAYADGQDRRAGLRDSDTPEHRGAVTASSSRDGRLADTDGRDTSAERQQRGGEQRQQPEDGGLGGMEIAAPVGLEGRAIAGREQKASDCRLLPIGTSNDADSIRPAGPTNDFWRDADWLYCRDGKWRPVEPGTFPLAHGATNRVGRLRGYGNAIVAPVAQTFIESVMGIL